MNGSMLQVLREATHASHESLDSLFGGLDMTSREGFARFLCAHLMGVRALADPFQRFVADELHLDPPDFPAMLEADLAAMNIDTSRLPACPAENALEPAGVTYVISGSRLGLAMIRKQPYWGKQADMATSYMEDTSGLAVWRSLLGWMSARAPDVHESDAAAASARHAFDVFREAFAISGDPPAPAMARA